MENTTPGFFEEFNDRLLSVIGKDVRLHEVKEPIGFDNPLFYFFLGISTGTFSILFLKFMLTHPNFIRTFQISMSCFVVVTGIYWLFCKPITGRYGQNKKIQDLAMGTVFIITGIALLVFA